MENKAPGRPFLPIVIIFIVSSLLFLGARQWLAARNIDYIVMLSGNGILFLATALSFYLYSKALHNANVQLFLRMLYASLLIKMVFSIAATLLYLFFAGAAVSKYAIIGCFGLYILYTYVEVKVLMRLIRKLPKNA
ncbi:MAG TPA: hypothetical protein VNS58_30980 [Puia sp.]|nr:hypothetical protein [Puia sp.]